MGAHWFEAPDVYHKLSPTSYATSITTPLLILHSEDDLRCPIGNAEDLFAILRLLINAMLIRGEQPMLLDTLATVQRDAFLERAFSLIGPREVRWLFLSHEDRDHSGSIMQVLEQCPNATLITHGGLVVQHLPTRSVSRFRQNATATHFDTSRANYCLPRPALCRARWVGRGRVRLRRPQ